MGEISHSCKVGPREVGSLEVGLLEVGPPEVGLLEVGPAGGNLRPDLISGFRRLLVCRL